MVVLAVLVAVRWDPGLADFLFWLTAIWIVLVRYMESSSSDGESLQLSRPALRKWLRFSAILVIAASIPLRSGKDRGFAEPIMMLHTIIFSDLDGTLLDDQTYSFEPARTRSKL